MPATACRWPETSVSGWRTLRRRGLDYSQFAWATITSNVLGLAAAAALGLIALAMLWMRAGRVPVPVVALSAAVSVLGLGGLVALGFLPRLAGHTWFQRWPWLSRMSGHEMSRRTIVSVVVFSFGRHGFNFLSFGLLYQALLHAPGQFLNGGLVLRDHDADQDRRDHAWKPWHQ